MSRRHDPRGSRLEGAGAVLDYRPLGGTGLRISPVGLGCGNFGGVGSAPELFGAGESESEAFRIMDVAVDLGINWFDTADAYGGGRSETFIGAWLKTQPTSVRDRLLLSSKVANPVGEGPNQRGLTRRHIRRQLEASLGRLGVDHLDLYLIHEPDPGTPLEQTLRAFDDLIRSGRVHYIGASNTPAWLLTKALWVSDRHGLHRFEWVQNGFNLLERSDERDVHRVCADQGLGYTPFGPLAGGLLTGKYRWGEDYPEGSRLTLRPEPYREHLNERRFSALERFREAAGDFGVSMAGLALAWVLHHPGVTAPVIGPRNERHFEPVREALALPLDPDRHAEIAALFEASTPP